MSAAAFLYTPIREQFNVHSDQLWNIQPLFEFLFFACVTEMNNVFVNSHITEGRHDFCFLHVNRYIFEVTFTHQKMVGLYTLAPGLKVCPTHSKNIHEK